MYVIVEMTSGGRVPKIHGVYGPFNNLQDEKLKKILKEKGLMPSYENEVENRWYAKPGEGVTAKVCAVKSDFSDML
jgi:hypothetical protein